MKSLKVFMKTFLILVLIVITLFFCGCFGGSSSGGTISNPSPHGTINGQVTVPDSIVLSVKPSATVRPDVKVPQATVWLLNDFNVHAMTDSNGNFALTPVPCGNQRIVAKVIKSDGKTCKIRTGEIQVSSEDPKDAGTIELEQANNKVQGVLLDSKGNPVAKGQSPTEILKTLASIAHAFEDCGDLNLFRETMNFISETIRVFPQFKDEYLKLKAEYFPHSDTDKRKSPKLGATKGRGR